LIKILLLEDDLLFGETLVDLLEENEYEVTLVPNGQSAIDATFDKKFHIYILDINVPLIDGITVLKELRNVSDLTPTIFLTSHKDKEKLTQAFMNGADDYITKPFDSDELLLRIQALLNRSNLISQECTNKLCHDKVHKRILYDKKEVDLSKKEYSLLLLLMKHANNTVPKELISNELWNTSQSSSYGAIRVYINRIKQLLPELSIENVRGIGYKLVS
jgi:DNA-binding response OmpR family regulator